jgi:hypothetical protein
VFFWSHSEHFDTRHVDDPNKIFWGGLGFDGCAIVIQYGCFFWSVGVCVKVYINASYFDGIDAAGVEGWPGLDSSEF